MSKYELVTINSKIVSIDLSELVKKENLFFNATEIAKQFGKLSKDYLENKTTKEYILARCGKDNSPFENYVKVTKGGKHQGTWLHHKLAIDFARWCSPIFAIELDDWIISKLQEEKQRKHDRQIARLEYPEMAEAVKEYWEEKGEYDNKKFYLFTNEADLINRTVLGQTAKQYCEENGIDRVCLRDNLPPKQIDLIIKLQKLNTSMIQIGIPFNERKLKLKQQYHKLIQKLLN